MVHVLKISVCQKVERFLVMVIFFLIFFFYGLQYLSPRLLFSVRVCGRQEELPCSYLTKDIVKWDGTKEEEAKHRGAQTQPTNKKQTWSVTWLIKTECENVISVGSSDWGPWSKWVTRGKRKTLKKKTYWDIDLPDLSGNKRDNEKK